MKNRNVATRLGLASSALLIAMAAGACGDSPAAPTTGGGTTAAPTLTQIQAQIFDASCVSCHTDVGRTPAGVLNLKAGSAFPNLFSQASSGLPGATRVVPGNPGGSYLVQKLEGAVGIAGLRMPRNGPPFLTDAQVKMVRDWITAGAQNN
jgi:mono/diheme cytochrome c family protein